MQTRLSVNQSAYYLSYFIKHDMILESYAKIDSN